MILPPEEVARLQAKCKSAFDLGLMTSGIESMKSFYRAFPFSANAGGDCDPLSLRWRSEYNLFMLSDSYGFLTLLREVDVEKHFLEFVKRESAEPGSLRELLTGKERPAPRHYKVPRFQKIPKKKKLKLTLEDLGL